MAPHLDAFKPLTRGTPPQPGVDHGTQYVRHIQTEAPLEIVVDGQSRHGVVMRPGKSFDVHVSQIAAFMSTHEDHGSPTS